MTAILQLSGVSVGYDTQIPPALEKVELAIRPGEVIAVLGPNGSGKSTLVKAMLGLVPIIAGTITGSGRRIGYVPQRQSVGGGVPATVEEVVASGRLLPRRFLPPVLSATERGLVADAIATVGLTEKIGHSVHTLSGGQQRRVLIARALAGQPDVLVMDEPFAGVDAANQEILAHTLTELADSTRTLVLVTHEIAPVARLVSRVVVVDHGRIRYDGPPNEAVLRAYGGPDAHGGIAPTGPAEENGSAGSADAGGTVRLLDGEGAV